MESLTSIVKRQRGEGFSSRPSRSVSMVACPLYVRCPLLALREDLQDGEPCDRNPGSGCAWESGSRFLFI